MKIFFMKIQTFFDFLNKTFVVKTTKEINNINNQKKSKYSVEWLNKYIKIIYCFKQ